MSKTPADIKRELDARGITDPMERNRIAFREAANIEAEKDADAKRLRQDYRSQEQRESERIKAGREAYNVSHADQVAAQLNTKAAKDFGRHLEDQRRLSTPNATQGIVGGQAAPSQIGQQQPTQPQAGHADMQADIEAFYALKLSPDEARTSARLEELEARINGFIYLLDSTRAILERVEAKLRASESVTIGASNAAAIAEPKLEAPANSERANDTPGIQISATSTVTGCPCSICQGLARERRTLFGANY